jgi:hypothetical protein
MREVVYERGGSMREVVYERGGLWERWSMREVVYERGGLCERWSMWEVVYERGSLWERWSIREVVSLEVNNLLVSEIWSDKRTCFWWEGPYKWGSTVLQMDCNFMLGARGICYHLCPYVCGCCSCCSVSEAGYNFVVNSIR